MKNSSKNNIGVLDTILALAGIVVGAFLITKLTQRETKEKPVSKESVSKQVGKVEAPEVKVSGVNERQQKIMRVVKEKGMITPKELQDLLPEVSTRTLRRDMDALAKAKLVAQKGSTKSTFYKYIGR